MKIKYLVVLIVLVNVVFGQVDVSMPERITGEVGDIIDIPITVSELEGLKIIVFQFVANYNTNIEIIGFEETEITSSLMMIDFYSSNPGTTNFGGSGVNELKGSGTFLIVKIKLLENGVCNFKIEEFMLNNIIYPINTLEIVIGDVKIEEENILDDFQLNQNYPNPFNPSTNIEFSLNKKSFVNLSIYDLSGRLADNLINTNQEAGIHNMNWNGSDNQSGIYIYAIKMSNEDGTEIFRDIKKMTLIK